MFDDVSFNVAGRPSRGFNVPRDAKPNQQPPGMSRFNTGHSFTTVTPGRRATRLLFANSYSIVMRVLSHVISSHRPDAAMYPRRDIEATLNIRNGHHNTGSLAKWLLRYTKHGAGSTIEICMHLFATLAGFQIHAMPESDAFSAGDFVVSRDWLAILLAFAQAKRASCFVQALRLE
ncbi:hypothetical protein Trihar35433_3076 [Trichoderma harzianum]|nr:hypothetical protein Trihar35433_3076 [Trichoderma harzianum]